MEQIKKEVGFNTQPCERTLDRNHKLLLSDLQEFINITHIPDSLREALKAKRRKFYQKKAWNISVERIMVYIAKHKDNFKDGKFYT